MRYYKKVVKIGFFCLALGFNALSIAAPAENHNTVSREDLEEFSNAFHIIKNNYVSPVTDKKLFEDAIRGMVAGLDPHSTYLDEEDLRDLKDQTTGEFSGLGMEVNMENGFLKVISPIDDTPAFKAGIKPGDLIVRLDETPIKGLTLRQSVNKMRGASGTKIKLTVIRKGESKPLLFTLTREIIHVQSVKSRLMENFGYVRITSFQTKTGHDLETAIADLKKKAGGNLRGLVLDLRNNPGGLLDSAIDVSDAFIPKNSAYNGLIVYTKGRLPNTQFEARATSSDILRGAPIVVLINEGSASAAEIVAGALQDHKRAVLVGTKSFGKGSVQTVIPLDGKTAIKLTTALYYTPSGRSIQAEGIEPDVYVENMKVSTTNEDKSLEDYKEANLAGHIANATLKGKNTARHPSAAEQEQTTEEEKDYTEKLATSDYQLNEALNVLKGLTTEVHNN